MKLKLDRIISIATLLAAVTAIVLVLKRPAPVVQPPAPAAVTSHSDSSDQRAAQPDPAPQHAPANGSFPAYTSGPNQAPQSAPQTTQSGSAASASPKPDTSAASDAVSSMIAKAMGGGAAGLSLDSSAGSGSPNIKDQQVTMDGDILHGKFLTEIGGKDVWVTISGHMGEKDGYATFDPTEIKVGDMEVPVALVNPALQRKLAEERDRLKIPTNGVSQ